MMRVRRPISRTVAAVAVCVVAAGCGSSGDRYVPNTYAISSGHDKHSVPIGSGRLGAGEWTLRAGQNGEGQLCMGVQWTPAAREPGDYGCGFGSNTVDDEGRGTEPVNQTENAEGLVLAYGPSPRWATRAVLTLPTIGGTDCRAELMDPTTVEITHSVPSWYPRDGTGWFTVQVPAAALTCPLDVTFLNADEHEVGQPNNF